MLHFFLHIPVLIKIVALPLGNIIGLCNRCYRRWRIKEPALNPWIEILNFLGIFKYFLTAEDSHQHLSSVCVRTVEKRTERMSPIVGSINCGLLYFYCGLFFLSGFGHRPIDAAPPGARAAVRLSSARRHRPRPGPAGVDPVRRHQHPWRHGLPQRFPGPGSHVWRSVRHIRPREEHLPHLTPPQSCPEILIGSPKKRTAKGREQLIVSIQNGSARGNPGSDFDRFLYNLVNEIVFCLCKYGWKIMFHFFFEIKP